MGEELKNKLDNFAKNIIMKSGSKKEVIPEIQKEYNELMEFFDTLTILTNEEFASLDKEMSKYEKLQEEINLYKSKNNIDNDKMEIKENTQKLNEDYNSLKQKYSCLYNDNIGFQMKLKTNEKIISDLQEEISTLKKENFEKFERINYLEKNYKLTEIKLNQAMEKISKYSVENNDLAKTNIELKNENLDLQKNYKSKIHVLER
jgi:chromosome segregation ATPase